MTKKVSSSSLVADPKQAWEPMRETEALIPIFQELYLSFGEAAR